MPVYEVVKNMRGNSVACEFFKKAGLSATWLVSMAIHCGHAQQPDMDSDSYRVARKAVTGVESNDRPSDAPRALGDLPGATEPRPQPPHDSGCRRRSG